MRRLIQIRFTLTAVLPLLTLAFTPGDHGPTMPPDPWDGIAALHKLGVPADATLSDHGPTMPPDPWDGMV
jgi:hypothetical protein